MQKWVVSTIGFLCAALMLLPFESSAQECVDLAQVIGREAARFDDSQQVDILRKSLLCTARYESASNEQRTSIEGSYGGFGAGGSGTESQIKVLQENQCDGHYGTYWSGKITSSDIRKVSEAGAEVVKECLKARSFRLISLRIRNEAIVSTFRYGGAGDTIINGMGPIPSSIAGCVARLNGHEHPNLGELIGTKLLSGDTLALDCERVAEPTGDSNPVRQHYRGGLLSVDTAADNASVPLIEYSVPAAPEPIVEQLMAELAAQRIRFEALEQPSRFRTMATIKRLPETNYHNDSNKTKLITVSLENASGGGWRICANVSKEVINLPEQGKLNNETTVVDTAFSGVSRSSIFTFVVPPGYYYSVKASLPTSVKSWTESDL